MNDYDEIIAVLTAISKKIDELMQEKDSSIRTDFVKNHLNDLKKTLEQLS